MSIAKVAVMAGLITLANAHGYVTGVVADGKYYQGWTVLDAYQSPSPSRVGWPEQALDSGFISPSAYATGDIICHKSATPAKLSATVAAGGKITLQWNTWSDTHKGPVIDYLAPCPGDCSTVDKSTLKFFKIDGVGLIDGSVVPGKFATDQLMANNNSWTVTIPSTIKAGNYVLRHEIIALHGAQNANGAQNYPQCVNLQITGSGSQVPSGVLGTALYTSTDPGILVNIYQKLASYVVPGPAIVSAKKRHVRDLSV